MSAAAVDSAIATAQSWLASGKAPPHRAAEVARALALQGHQIPLNAATFRDLGADIEAALLHDASERNDVDLAGGLAEFATDKTLAKQAKKLLFKLKQKGVHVPERPQNRAPVDLSARPAPLPSLASSIDAAGGQLLFLGGWHPTDGPWCVMAMITDRDGLLSGYYVAGTSRTQQKELIAKLRHQINGFTVEVPSDFVAGRLRWALDLRDKHDKIFEGDVAEVRRILDGVEPLEEVEFALDPEDEAQLGQHLEASATLSAEGCFHGWFDPGKPELDKLQSAIADLAGSHAERYAKALQLRTDVWDRWLGRQEIPRLAGRMELNSWLLHCVQKPTAALQALACARALRTGSHWSTVAAFNQVVENLAPLGTWLPPTT